MIDRRSARPQGWRYAFLTALLTSAAATPAMAAAEAAADAAPPATMSEIVVTATKRSENLQKVPISMQALTPQILAQHQVASFDDYAKLLPSVSFQSFGPGQSSPYFRGIASGDTGGALHSGSLPGTGLYLDETPVTTVGNGLDLHVYDIARVEALSGPQGTLFGASSLSGTLRIITNAPDPTKFSAAYDLQANKFGSGGVGGVAEGYVNIPVTDRVAIRLVAFDEHDGGYIDNVPKTREYILEDGSTLSTNNAKYVKKNFNDVDTYGGRAALKVELDDNWTVTPSIVYQHQHARGNFLYNPRIGDLKTSDFAEEFNKDKWYQAAMTIQGKIANWDILYSGGYFGRHVDNASDYSYYAVAYDNPAGLNSPSYVTFPDGHGGFLDPNQQFTGQDRYTKETHELRLSSPTQYKLRGIAGVFYERQTDRIIANYIVPGLGSSGDPRAIPGAGDDIYYTNIDRIDRDFALFGELAYDILPNLTATIGGRYFEVDNTLEGVSGFSGATPFAKGTTEYGETHKVNLSWKIDPDRLIYVTYSTGFRPGGVNRRSVLGTPPITIGPYRPDIITNYEIGAKTTWLDGRLRINGAIFEEVWDDLQFALSPPGAAGITAIFNVGYAKSKGIEGDISYRPDDHWTLSGSGTLVDAKISQTFCSVTLEDGTCQTENVLGPYDFFVHKGDRLPIQPKYKLNATARYDFWVGDYKSFVQGALQTQGKTRSALVGGDAETLGSTKAFTTADFSAGFSRSNWTVEAFIQNAFDERGILSINTNCSIGYCGPYSLNYPTKPRFFGAKFGMSY